MRISSVRHRWAGLLGWAFALALCSAGCLKRTETFRVLEDGSIHLAVVIEGDADDVSTGDPLLTSTSPWQVKEERETEDDGQITLRRSAERTFKPGEAIPTSYAGPDDEHADRAARFDTSLVLEKRDDGVYYHFRRVYKARPWARFDYERKRIVDERIDPLGERSPAELSPTELEELAKALIESEKVKWIALTDAACDEMGAAMTQDQRLAVRRAVVTLFDQIPIAYVATVLTSDDDDLAADEAKCLRQQCQTRVHQVTHERLAPAAAKDFDVYMDKIQQNFLITEDIGDDTWEVTLQLPGVLVDHNGTLSEDGAVSWEFEGTGLRDRDVALLATSCVMKTDSDDRPGAE